MLIPVKRHYINSGLKVEILLNTRYVVKMEPYDDDHTDIKTKVVFDSLNPAHGPDVMYLLDSISGIKTKVGLIRNRKKNGTKRTPK
jgi:hypothetical protein